MHQVLNIITTRIEKAKLEKELARTDIDYEIAQAIMIELEELKLEMERI